MIWNTVRHASGMPPPTMQKSTEGSRANAGIRLTLENPAAPRLDASPGDRQTSPSIQRTLPFAKNENVAFEGSIRIGAPRR